MLALHSPMEGSDTSNTAFMTLFEMLLPAARKALHKVPFFPIKLLIPAYQHLSLSSAVSSLWLSKIDSLVSLR